MKTYLDLQDVKQIESCASSIRDRLLIRLLFRLGCRVSEVLAIKVSDIDFKKATVTILHLKRCLKLSCPGCKVRLGKGHRFCPGCGKEITEAMKRQQEQRRMRTLPIDKQSMEMLNEYTVDKGITLGNDSRLIFDLNRHRAWQIVRSCARRAGLPDLINPETGWIRGVSPHRLRDAFSVHAMKLDNSGDGLRLLQEHLGHASFDTTAKYRKIAGDEHRKWYDRLWPESN